MEAKTRSRGNIFTVPVLGQILLYAPLHNFAALLNPSSIPPLKKALLSQESTGIAPLDEILDRLSATASPPPVARAGAFAPRFLGLLPTRACNLTCKYCAFQNGRQGPQFMDIRLACRAIDWYIDLIGRAGQERLEIHYFGGEPFCAEELIDLSFHYAKMRAGALGYATHFEAATNGAFGESRCRWIADNFDTIVLSLDGPPEVHDHHRRRKDGRKMSGLIARNARILSEGPVKLCIRACVTESTVARLEAFAAWFCRMFRPQAVCFEPLQATPQAIAAGLSPPDPWRFASNFIRAAHILKEYGVEAMYATADIRTRQVTFCPVGRDVAIVSPDGAVNACYLLDRDWQAKGLDMRLGAVRPKGPVVLERAAVESIRRLNVLNKPACEGCFCKWHCAGGCHVNNTLSATPGPYNRLCIQTRLITLHNILETMGQEGLMDRLLSSPAARERLMQPHSDAIQDEIEDEHRCPSS